MTLDQFNALCERQYENGYGDVRELHLDEAAYKELTDSVYAGGYPPMSSVLNQITGTMVKIVRHENHAIVERPPQPPPTTQKVKI